MSITDLTVAAASTAVNASVTPAAPSGLQPDDNVYIFAAIRNAGAGAPVEPAGWVTVTALDNIAVFARRWQTGDTMPLITFTGGVANADTYARALKLRGASSGLTDAAANEQSNASAQNIAWPVLDVPRDGSAVIMAAWKQDDATSLGTPVGWTANGHTNMTTGDDMLAAWFTQIQTTEADIAASSITVTGGVAAISKVLMIGIPPAATIIAVEQDVHPPRVLVTVGGLDGEQVDVYRSVLGERTLLRGGSSEADDPNFLVLDAELPFGVPVSYVAVVDGAEYSTTATTYDLPDGPYMSRPAFTDAVTGQAATAVIVSWPDKEYGRDAAVMRLAGGRNAVVSGPLGQFTSTLTLHLETLSERNNLDALLKAATSGTIQIRQGGAYSGVDCYVSVLSHRVQRFSQDGTDERRTYVLEVAEVNPWPESLLTRGWTYADLEDAFSGQTYVDLDTSFSTYLLLASADGF